VNGETIKQVPMDTVTYHHVELPRHDVLLAEGLPAESYLDTGTRQNFANADSVTQLHADFHPHPSCASLNWEAKGYAPLVLIGPRVEAIRRRLDQRAENDEPDRTERQSHG
jgi:hypothetical protein